MKKNRSIKSIVYANQFDMGGMPVRQAFPSSKAESIDPFLLLHHAEVKVPTHIPALNAGVGPHPHRGFSPVTFIFKGGVHHRDSRGNNNIVYEGGTQWMNAGMGIVHSERPPSNIQEIGGIQEIIQLWVNTPSAHKMDQPTYIPLTAEDTPSVISKDEMIKINIHSGELNGVKGPILSFSPVNTFTVNAKQGGHYYFDIPTNHNAFIYLLHGKIKISGEADDIDSKYVAVLNNDGQGFDLIAMENSVIIIGTGEPINEPIVSHGPFVMNTQSEIMEAFRDYEMGKMGVLIED